MWLSLTFLARVRKVTKESRQGENRFEFCLRKILHTFSPLEPPFDFRKLCHVFVGRGLLPPRKNNVTSIFSGRRGRSPPKRASASFFLGGHVAADPYQETFKICAVGAGAIDSTLLPHSLYRIYSNASPRFRMDRLSEKSRGKCEKVQKILI